SLTSAPWHPSRPGDIVHVAYEETGTMPAAGETYLVGDAGDGLMSLTLLSQTFPGLAVEDAAAVSGVFVAEAADDPLYELWFEAGPHRLTIVRDGRTVHDGTARRRETPTAAGPVAGALALAAAISDAEMYLQRGEPELALARLQSDKPLPPCGTPGVTPEQADCARPWGHRGMCSDNPDHVEPPHTCPALPEQLHAVVTVGAKVADVHFAGLYEDRWAATDHAMGFHAYRGELDRLTERFVTPAPGLPGETILKLPQENELQATGVQLAVVVPLSVLPDPRDEDVYAADGMDYADDVDDDFRDVDE
ncbi:MAG TPA: hypothetical protein VFN19_00070, partial [Candidatus Nanopelagicales bacterium]|nr:hypothetical protein [Candidatus Nanopelagicales bacterium]